MSDGAGNVMALDAGASRIGVAIARSDIWIAQPLTTLQASDDNDNAIGQILTLVDEHQVGQLVVGWPRGLAGQSTDQTKIVEAFADNLRKATTVPVELQDEALTSQKAEAELAARRKPYTKEDIDALAATFILEDYLESHHA